MSDSNYSNGYQRATLKAQVRRDILAALAKLSPSDQTAMLFDLAAERESLDGGNVDEAARNEPGNVNRGMRAMQRALREESSKTAENEDENETDEESDSAAEVDATIMDTLQRLVDEAPLGLTTAEAYDELLRTDPSITTSKTYVGVALNRLVGFGRIRTRKINSPSRRGRKLYLRKAKGGASK